MSGERDPARDPAQELKMLSAARAAAAAEVEAAEATHAELEGRLAASAALLAAKRRQLAVATRAEQDCETEALKQLVLAPLLSELIHLIFLLLPVDSRLRCREVSRGWRAFLADLRHWQVCDLSLTSGVVLRSPALLHAACERARGTLRVLDVSGWYYTPVVGRGEDALRLDQLLPVLTQNAPSLLELRAWKPVDNDEGYIAGVQAVERLLSAAPRLRLLQCDAYLDGDDSRGPLPHLLREPQFAPLRLQTLNINADDAQPPPDVPLLASWAATHPTLKRLRLWHVMLDNELALDAVVDLAISQLEFLNLIFCQLSPASLPPLTRMLERSAGGGLVSLNISNLGHPLIAGAALVPAFCAALRTSRLVELHLRWMHLWESPEDGLAVVAACTGHPTLRELSFWGNNIPATASAAVGVALAALVDADSALESLNVSDCSLDDAALRLFFAAVASSTLLRKLDCSDNHISAECAESVILPAVQANTSLRELEFYLDTDNGIIPELEQAVELVQARS